MINTALDQASLWGKYTWYDGPLAGLGLGAGVRYVSDTYGDASTPSWSRPTRWSTPR